MSLQAYTIIVYVKNTYVSCQYSLHNHGVCHTPRYHVNADLHNHGLHQKTTRYHVNTGLPNHGLCHTPRYMYHVNTGLHNHGLYQKTPSYNVNTDLHNHGLHHTPRYHVNKGYTIMVYVRNTMVSCQWASEGKHTQQPTMPYHTSPTSSYTYIIHLFN